MKKKSSMSVADALAYGSVIGCVLAASVFVGFRSNSEIGQQPTPAPAPIEKPETAINLIPGMEFEQISVSTTKGVNAVLMVEEDARQLFTEIFSTAKKEPGIVDMIEPEYSVKVVYEGNKTENLSLWVGEKGQNATLMNERDTHTIYTVSSQLNERLIEIVEAKFVQPNLEQ